MVDGRGVQGRKGALVVMPLEDPERSKAASQDGPKITPLVI